ncbi:META domain-containing protein [Caulobacter endophyticus]|uniref:META domain-containing protein n=1 Tax=Caulobacter endophyticus TaxID=2172652 RepID=UPI0024108555|nr:META domain-containing protein [Caulobacter endophyticus]MDG2531947.1 META domain-containing protein [Caulobacter endophyticus]
MSARTRAAFSTVAILVALIGWAFWLISDVAFEKTWRVERLEGALAPPGGAEIWFTGRRNHGRGQPFEVRTACDVYSGRYSRRFGRLEIRRLQSAGQHCAADAPLLASIEAAHSYRYEGRRLLLEAKDGKRLALIP